MSIKKSNFKLRNKINKLARFWFEQNNFLEVETPILSSYSSLEKYIYPLTTKVIDDKKNIKNNFLRVSPELAHKKLIASGYENIFEIGKCFRNYESSNSSQHLVEFNLLEWYQLGSNLNELMEKFISFINCLFQQVLKSQKFEFNKNVNDLTTWRKVSIKTLFKTYAEIDFDKIKTWDELIPLVEKKIKAKKIKAKTNGISKNQAKNTTPYTLDEAFYWIFLNEIEDKLKDQPTIIYHYPDFQSSFSKIFYDQSKKGYGLRFEAYLGGLEIANAFEELCDPHEQQNRWQESQIWFQQNFPKDHFPMDKSFLHALKVMATGPSLAGIAIGWDRIMMLLADEKNIKKVVF